MKAGFVSFVGRPNAGKSTLLNRIVGQKLAIVSDKPQTTRTRVVGVKNYDGGQIVFVDTPGVEQDVAVVRAGFRLASGDPHATRHPPELGAHTRSILKELGLSDAEIAALQADGAT